MDIAKIEAIIKKKKASKAEKDEFIMEYTADKILSRINSFSNKHTMTDATLKFIVRAIFVHGDRYDYSKVNYQRAIDEVEIICPVHGSFFQRPSAHTSNGSGCKKCAFENISRNRKKRRALLKTK